MDVWLGDDAGGEGWRPEDLVVGVVEVGAGGGGVVVSGDAGDEVELEGGFEFGCEGTPVEDEFAGACFVEVDEFFLFEGFELPELGFECAGEVETSEGHGEAAFGGVAQGGGESDGFTHACAAFVEFGLEGERDGFAGVGRKSIVLKVESKRDRTGAFEAQGEGVFAGAEGFSKISKFHSSQLILGEALFFELLSIEDGGDAAIPGFGGEVVLVGHDRSQSKDGGLCCAVSAEALVFHQPLDSALECGFGEWFGFEHREDGEGGGFDVQVVARRRGDGDAAALETAVGGLCGEEAAQEFSGLGIFGAVDLERGGRGEGE